MENGAAQLKKGDLESARQYLSLIAAQFRLPGDPQTDPEGYAVYRMASALSDSLKGVTALAPMDLELEPIELPAIDYADVKIKDFRIADTENSPLSESGACPYCATLRKVKT